MRKLELDTEPWEYATFQKLLETGLAIKTFEGDELDSFKHIIACLTLTLDCNFAPFCAFLGGLASQEIVKFLTQKFKPVHQVAYFDVLELMPERKEVDLSVEENFTAYAEANGINEAAIDDRFADLNAVLGRDTVTALGETNLFMVGAGAIGCELLKNFALLGVGTGAKGGIVLTDPDIIEVSNLNRQFLFREKHLRKPKSQTAAAAAVVMNPALQGHIFPRLDKVHPGTADIFSESFFKQ